MAKIIKTVTERLPDRPTTILIQADIDSDLHARVKIKMDQLRKTKFVTWKSLIEASLEKWVEEN